MRKLIEKDLSYYRVDLHTGNVIYLSHAIDVKEDDFIDLSVRDIIAKIDELVEAFNNLTSVAMNSADEIIALKTQIKARVEQTQE